MFRVISLVVLLAVSFYVVRLVLSNRKRQRFKKFKGKAVSPHKKKNNMVRCIHCSLHLLEEEAIKQGDNIFCSLKHASQHRKQK
jgi:hypothetical protein